MRRSNCKEKAESGEGQDEHDYDKDDEDKDDDTEEDDKEVGDEDNEQNDERRSLKVETFAMDPPLYLVGSCPPPPL